MAKSPYSPTLNAVVSKHNSLLPKLAGMELSELRLLTFCLAHYDSRPEYRASDGTLEGISIPQEYLAHQATVKDLLDIFPGMDRKSAYAVVRKAVKGINSKPFEDTLVLPNGKTEDVLLYWFSGFRYSNEEGRFTFMLSPDIVSLVLSLDSDFTRFRLRHVYQFKSAITWKLYELLKQWVAAGRWAVGLDELRMSIGVAGKYSAWCDFKKRILDNPIKEINGQSDIIVKYEKKKHSRSINGVVFFIKSKEDEAKKSEKNIVSTVGDTNRDMKLLMAEGLSQTQSENISKLAKDAGKDLKVFLERIKSRYEAKPESERQGSKIGYIYKSLYEEFTPNLFDVLENKKIIKIDEAEVKKQSQKNNKLAKEVLSCPGFQTRSKTGICKFEKAKTDKCKTCNKLIAKT